MSDQDYIKLGVSVQIRRNDGRMHPAIVSSVNKTLHLVTVEWYEGGDTKGKEVDIDSVYALNPHIRRHSLELEREHKQRKTRSARVSSVPVKSKSRLTLNKSSTDLSNKNQPRSSSQQHSYRSSSHNMGVTTTKVDGYGQNVTYEIPKPQPSSFLNYVHKPEKSKSKQSLGKFMGAGEIFSDNDKSEKEHVQTRAREEVSPLEGNAIQTTATVKKTACRGPKLKKKTNTVIEVERLQKNREERRIRQAEQKEEKEALLNKHSGNPNWQFQEMIKNYQETLEFKPLKDSELTENHQITVCVRKRPLNKREKAKKEIDVVSVPRKDLVILHEPKNKVDLTKYLENQQFRFDFAFDDTCTNEIVYNYTAKPLVQTIFEGGMATCFAYGQTGSGKTHTMGGSFSNNAEKGIYALVAQDVFEWLQSPQYVAKKLFVTCSFFEIYGGKVFDLLAHKERLRVLEDGKQQVQIVGLTEKVVSRVEDVLSIIDCGNAARTSGQTSANANSSRSHAVFQMTLRNGNTHQIHGKFHLIDLAGNERGADTSSSNRVTRLEGAEINKSLLALKECIRALGRKGSHLPFRGSTLTLVLRDSFIGDKAKTCMIAMISPGMSSCEHSLNTLRYADRVKELVVACDPDPQEDSESIELNWSLNPAEGEGYTSSCGDEEEFDEEANDKRRLLLQAQSETDLVEKQKTQTEDVEGFPSQFQLIEKSLLETLGVWREMNHKWDSREEELDGMAHEDGYNPDYFVSELQEILQERQNIINVLKEKVNAFREQISSHYDKQKS